MFFSDKIVVYYRNSDVNPNVVCQFQVSEVNLSMDNDTNDFLWIRYVNFCLDALSKELVLVIRLGELKDVQV